jgi:tetratricopeptide (TPR) repeat protein
MARRRFNWIAAVVLVIAVSVLVLTAYALRKWQRKRMAYAAYEIGLKAFENHRWEDATTHLGRYVVVNHTNIDILLKYAQAQLNIRPLKRGNIQQALASYRSILRLDENNTAAGEKLVSLYLSMNIASEAQLIAERFLQTNDEPNIRRLLAVSLAQQRKVNDAATQLKTIIEQHPEQILAYETLGWLVALHPRDFQLSAQTWFDEVVNNNPFSAHAFLVRAAFYLKNNEYSKAVADLEKAEKLDLSDSQIRLRLAAEFINANMLDRAWEHLAEIQASEPGNLEVWKSRATIALKAKSNDQMCKVADAGLKELAPYPWDFMPLATELFIRCMQFDRAAECIAKLKEKDVGPVLTVFLEGLLAQAKNQHYKAIRDWQRAIQLGDNSEKTRLALAQAYSRAGDNQSAIAQLRSLLAERPELLQAHLELAGILMQVANWADAAEHARLAAHIAPENLDAALLHIQARLRLIETTHVPPDAQIIQQLQDDLRELDGRTDGELKVKLLQFQLELLRGHLDEAKKQIMDLKARDETTIEAAIAEVDLLRAEDKLDQSVSKLYGLTQQFPQNPLPVRYLATVLYSRDKKEECEKVLENAIKRIDDPVAKRDLTLLLAHLYKQWNQAEKLYSLLVTFSQQRPEDISIKCRLLRCKQVAESPNQAQILVDQIKAIEGQHGWVWRWEQANLWFNESNFKDYYPQIITLLKTNLLANPADQTSRMLLAATYEKSGELQLAVTTYTEALNNAPDDISVIVPTVTALYRAKEYDRADKILSRAATKKLTHPEMAKLKLQSYLRQGKLSSAETILEDLASKNADNHGMLLSLALLKIRQNKYQQARELLNKLRAQELDSVPIAAALVELNIREEKNDNALALCNQVINQHADASAYILRAKTYSMLGQMDLANNDFEKAASIEPNNPQVWVFKSDFHRSAGRHDQAVEDIQKALLLYGDNLNIQKRAVALLLFSGEPEKTDQGRQLLDKALAANPQDAELRLYKARLLLSKRTAPAIQQAENILQTITRDQPKIADAWTMWAQIYREREQLGEAIDILMRGLAYLPNDKTLLLLKAQVEADRAPELAVPTLKSVNEIYPNDSDAVLMLAEIYTALGQNQNAIDLLEKQLTYAPLADHRRISQALAVTLYKNGDHAEATDKLNSLYGSEPNDPATLIAQARLLEEDKLWTQLGQIVTNWYRNHPDDVRTPVAIARRVTEAEDSHARQTAEAILQAVLSRDPASVGAMTALAILLQTDGRSAQAAKIYERILDIDPDAVVAINNLAWILTEDQGKYGRALELTQSGLRKAPEYIDLIDTRGVIYYRLGQFHKATQDFTRCVELYPTASPSLVASYFHLGRSLAALGRSGQAIHNLQKALELNNKWPGLSHSEIVEAKRLLEELSQEKNHVPVANR